jgi:hypothetical protein
MSTTEPARVQSGPARLKKRLPAAELVAELDRQAALHPPSAGCRFSQPRALPLRSRSYYSANWRIDTVGGMAKGSETFVTGIVSRLMREYDCSDWP